MFGFALIWHMWLLAGASFAALLLASIIHTFNYKRDFYIPASEVKATEEARTPNWPAMSELRLPRWRRRRRGPARVPPRARAPS